MQAAELLRIARRYTFAFGQGYLSSFLSLLSMLGLVLAIALLVTVMSVMNGFDREMRERILGLVPHITLFAHLPEAEWEAARERVVATPGVVQASPFARFDALMMNGATLETALVLGLDLTPGQLPPQFEQSVDAESLAAMRADPRGLLLGSQLAQAAGLSVGDGVTLIVPADGGLNPRSARYERVTLRGVLHTGTELDNSSAVVHLAQAGTIQGRDTAIAGLRVAITDLFQAGELSWTLQRDLPPGFYATHWMMTHGNLYAAIQLSRDLISLLLFSIIAVAAFNVVSSLVLVVFDKQGDIAILRTLGATPRHILGLFLLQGALIGLVGAVLGSALGVLASLGVTDLVAGLEAWLGIQFLDTDVYPVAFLPSDLLWRDVVWVAGVAFVMCLLAAIYPALRAARLAPAQVLHAD